MALTIAGLGPGPAEDLTRRAWAALEAAPHILLRTQEHPCVPLLPGRERTESFDRVYESTGDFAVIYATIVEQVLQAAREGDVLYAVPGDPWMGEATVKALVARAREAGIPCTVIHGLSFVEPALGALGIDAVDGLQVVDALEVGMAHHPPLNTDMPALLAQVYSRAAASEVKLTLMNAYPDDFRVALIHGAGSADDAVEWLPLYEIDRSARIGHLTTLYLPALGEMSSFERFQETIAHLRAPEGCPWDREQTHLSLRRYLIEEAYEVLEALDAEDPQALCEELGDLLLQVALHTQIATEDGEFRMADVLRTINAKLIRRHPHVWGTVQADNPEQVTANWAAIKQAEKAGRGDAAPASLLDGAPKALPALMHAVEITHRAARPGFDWPVIDDVWAKLDEEIAELREAQGAHQAEELGDVLFVLANLARWLKIDPEAALRATSAKFYRRFSYIEREAAAAGRALHEMTLEEMDALWNAAKANGL